MRRIITSLLILGVGALVLWEAFAWGTRTWVKYGILKQPLPSVTTFLTPVQQFLPMLTTFVTAVVLLIAVIITYFRARKLFGLIPLMTELTRHLVVLGPTGSGKTTVAKTIADKVLRKDGVSLIVIDWKGEYVQHLPDAKVVRKIPNIWDVPGDNPRERALVAVELIREAARDVIDISPPSALLLLRVLEEEYKKGVPTTEAIMAILDRYAQIAQREGKFAEANMYFALLRRLYVILADEERKAENVEGDPRILVYDLARLPSIYIKTLYANYILATLYRSATKAGTSDRLKTLLVAEEAQNYVRPRRRDELPSIGERLIFELRAFGVGAVLVCPDPELLPEAVLKDVGSIISLSPDSLPRFALERYLFRASLEEAERTLKELKKAKMIVYHKGNLHFFRRLPKPPKELKPKARPKGDRWGSPTQGAGSLRAWPILSHRSPGRPKVVEVKEVEEKPKVIEVVAEERTKVEPKAVEVEKPKVAEEPLRLEEEEYEEPEIEVEKPEPVTEPIEEKKVEESVEVKEEKVYEEEKEEMVEEEVPPEPEPAPKGPPIPSSPLQGIVLPSRAPPPYTRLLIYVIGCPAGWGRKSPVGDPLTPEGGPGRAELRLEEEVEVKEEAKEETEGEEVSEAPSPQQGWELFGHLLVEDLQARGRTSVMRCVRCGASAPLTGLKALKEMPCKATHREVVVSLPRKCENCGREATASLCDSCAVSFEKYAEAARPAPLRGRGGIKPPNVPGVDGWGWVSSLTTFFPFRKLEGGGREWWCPVPGCQMKSKKLVDVTDHFREAHPLLASRGWYEEYDARSRQVRIRTWQGWVDEQTLMMVMDRGDPHRSFPDREGRGG